jgi:P27 family predicted phage terminase small subunit
MGNARMPVNLLLIKGKKHHTKAEIQERIEQEIKAPADNVKYPKYLPKELRPEYNKISKALVDLGIFTNLDVDCLARFLVAREQYVKTTDVLRDINPGDDIVYYGRVLQVQDKLFVQVTKASQELGLSVNARGRLLVPKKKEEKKDEAGEKFGV